MLQAEATLERKEEENADLQEQLQQFETRWSEYEARMKSMQDVWQKQMSSLQVSFLVLVCCQLWKLCKNSLLLN